MIAQRDKKCPLFKFQVCFGRQPQKTYLKVRLFPVTFETSRKNDQIQGIVESTLILQRKFRSYCIDFSVSGIISLEQSPNDFLSEKYDFFDLYQEKMIMVVFCYINTIPVKEYRERERVGSGGLVTREYMGKCLTRFFFIQLKNSEC